MYHKVHSICYEISDETFYPLIFYIYISNATANATANVTASATASAIATATANATAIATANATANATAKYSISGSETIFFSQICNSSLSS